jgi:hypothetical protein
MEQDHARSRRLRDGLRSSSRRLAGDHSRRGEIYPSTPSNVRASDEPVRFPCRPETRDAPKPPSELPVMAQLRLQCKCSRREHSSRNPLKKASSALAPTPDRIDAKLSRLHAEGQEKATDDETTHEPGQNDCDVSFRPRQERKCKRCISPAESGSTLAPPRPPLVPAARYPAAFFLAFAVGTDLFPGARCGGLRVASSSSR